MTNYLHYHRFNQIQYFRLTYVLFAQTESPENEKGNEKIKIDWNILILKENNAPETTCSYTKRMTIKTLCFDRILNRSVKSENQTGKKRTKEKKQKSKSNTLNWYPCLLTRSRLWKYWVQCRGFGGVTSRSTSSNTRMFGDGGICLGMARSRYSIEKGQIDTLFKDLNQLSASHV